MSNATTSATILSNARDFIAGRPIEDLGQKELANLVLHVLGIKGHARHPKADLVQLVQQQLSTLADEAESQPEPEPEPEPEEELTLAAGQVLVQGYADALERAMPEALADQPDDGTGRRVTRSDLLSYDKQEAQRELELLVQWRKKGRHEGEVKPATPNHDAMLAAYAKATEKPYLRPEATAQRAERRRAAWRGRYAEALAEKKAKGNKRGIKGRRVDLAEYINKVLADDPDAVASQELEVAYWLEHLAVSRKTWMNTWAAVVEAREQHGG